MAFGGQSGEESDSEEEEAEGSGVDRDTDPVGGACRGQDEGQLRCQDRLSDGHGESGEGGRDEDAAATGPERSEHDEHRVKGVVVELVLEALRPQIGEGKSDADQADLDAAQVQRAARHPVGPMPLSDSEGGIVREGGGGEAECEGPGRDAASRDGIQGKDEEQPAIVTCRSLEDPCGVIEERAGP